MQLALGPFTDTETFLLHSLQHAQAQDVVDLGCGDGAICALLERNGFRATGIDPLPEAIAAAKARGLAARFHEGQAEALPHDIGTFDAAIFVNALHHVATAAMQDALRAALSVLRPNGVLVVVEPMPSGSFFRAMRPIEDETDIRKDAAAAVESLIAQRGAVLRDLSRWSRESRFRSYEEFTARMEQVDPQRGEIIRQKPHAVSRAWRDNIQTRGGVAVLHQPMICWTLTPP